MYFVHCRTWLAIVQLEVYGLQYVRFLTKILLYTCLIFVGERFIPDFTRMQMTIDILLDLLKMTASDTGRCGVWYGEKLRAGLLCF
jgi:hypothetical protein